MCCLDTLGVAKPFGTRLSYNLAFVLHLFWNLVCVCWSFCEAVEHKDCILRYRGQMPDREQRCKCWPLVCDIWERIDFNWFVMSRLLLFKFFIDFVLVFLKRNSRTSRTGSCILVCNDNIIKSKQWNKCVFEHDLQINFIRTTNSKIPFWNCMKISCCINNKILESRFALVTENSAGNIYICFIGSVKSWTHKIMVLRLIGNGMQQDAFR